MTDRYVKAILTVIAIELLWLGVKDIGTPVSAQAAYAPTPVIIRGIELRPERITNVMTALPMYAVEPVEIETKAPLPVEAPRPLPVEAPRPLPIVGSVPLRIEVDKPIPVNQVGYTPGRRPGE